MTILAVQSLSKAFGGVHAVRNLSFTVAAGEIVALIGPNGAGKSTCFNMVGGQLRPDSGSVMLNNPGGPSAALTGRSPRAIWRLGVGRTFQVTATFASMTVRENVQMALITHRGGVWRFWRRAGRFFAEEADRLLDQVGLARQAERGAGILAYGDLKRLELAMALASAPRLLLMDEPTAGMAASERMALMRLARDLASTQGIAILFTEHDMDAVFGVSDRILVLDRGAIIAEGTGAEIRANPEVRAVYLGTGLTSGGH
jgi:branched-chain amino acid transport system ATP-binding protein